MTIAELKQSIDQELIYLANARRNQDWSRVEASARLIATTARAIQLEMRADEAGVVRLTPPANPDSIGV